MYGPAVMYGNRSRKGTQVVLRLFLKNVKQHGDHMKGFFNSWIDSNNKWNAGARNVKLCLKVLNTPTYYVLNFVCNSTLKNVKIMAMS
jgi:hypothetical protein